MTRKRVYLDYVRDMLDATEKALRFTTGRVWHGNNGRVSEAGYGEAFDLPERVVGWMEYSFQSARRTVQLMLLVYENGPSTTRSVS